MVLSGIDTVVKEYTEQALFKLEQAGLPGYELCTVAAEYASVIHQNQKRLSTLEPYAQHVLRVGARIVNRFEVLRPVTYIGGVLHDGPEDQIDVVCLEANLPPTPENAIVALANRFAIDGLARVLKGMQNSDAEEHIKEAFVVKVIAMESDPEVATVKLSDFFDNALTVPGLEDNEIRTDLAQWFDGMHAIHIDQLKRGKTLVGENLSRSQRQALIQSLIEEIRYGKDLNDQILKNKFNNN